MIARAGKLPVALNGRLGFVLVFFVGSALADGFMQAAKMPSAKADPTKLNERAAFDLRVRR